MTKIKIVIVDIGNCANSLIQGLYFYKDKKLNSSFLEKKTHAPPSLLIHYP